VTAETNISDADWINRLLCAIDEFRKINQDITANQMAVFLTVAMKPGSTQRELSEVTGLADGTISRIIAILSDRGLGGKAGAGVLSIDPVPGDYRVRAQNLTLMGRLVVNSLRSIMTGCPPRTH
jgi:DNA-binding MarR family transcriptional regulator